VTLNTGNLVTYVCLISIRLIVLRILYLKALTVNTFMCSDLSKYRVFWGITIVLKTTLSNKCV